MKKRKLKKWVKETIAITIVMLIGIGCIFTLSLRAEQIDRSMTYEKSN